MVSGSFGHEAKSYVQTSLVTNTAPMLSGHRQFRCANTVQATDWPVHLLHQYMGGMWSTCSAGCAEVNIALS